MNTNNSIGMYQRWPDGRSKMIQEIFIDDPFKIMVGCILLNLTTHVQVRRVIYKLFEKWPTPKAMSSADASELSNLLRPLGMQNRRANTLIRFANEWLGDWDDPIDLYGIGTYAKNSYEIFVNKNLDVKVKDKELTKYLENKWHLSTDSYQTS